MMGQREGRGIKSAAWCGAGQGQVGEWLERGGGEGC